MDGIDKNGIAKKLICLLLKSEKISELMKNVTKFAIKSIEKELKI